jgi:hypothetical protein
MRKTLRVTAIIFVILAVAFAASQLIRPERTNPPTDASHSIEASAHMSKAFVAILNRACNDCHSNQTVWSRFTNVAPLSWLVAYGVSEGRKAVNFSQWNTYTPAHQRELLAQACQDVTSGKMPGSPYTMLRPEAQLSAHDVDTICAAVR